MRDVTSSLPPAVCAVRLRRPWRRRRPPRAACRRASRAWPTPWPRSASPTRPNVAMRSPCWRITSGWVAIVERSSRSATDCILVRGEGRGRKRSSFSPAALRGARCRGLPVTLPLGLRLGLWLLRLHAGALGLLAAGRRGLVARPQHPVHVEAQHVRELRGVAVHEHGVRERCQDLGHVIQRGDAAAGYAEVVAREARRTRSP